MKICFLIIMAVLISVNIGYGFATSFDTNYTFDSDFEKGNLTGLEHDSIHNQLQLSNSSSSANQFIWIPNSNEGTVSKVNTITGMEVARYKTSNLTYSNPSRTTVDLNGNCWVGNRNIGTVIKIGLSENDQWIDRNHNGVMDTCQDWDGNGVINSTEILPWGEDECVLWEVILIPGSEGNFAPGEYNGSYANDYYNPGPRGLAIDSKNNLWVGTYGTMKYYYVNGSNGDILKIVDVSSVSHTPYGAVIDQNGILWSSGNAGNNILRLDPFNDTFTRINIPQKSYGLAIDRNNHLFISGLDYCRITCINVINGTIEWTKTASYAQGITVSDDGDIWTADNNRGTVTRYSNNGDFKATIIVGNTPSGVSVDNMGKIWAVDTNDEYIHRINPYNNLTNNEGNIINGVEFSKRIVGGTHYGYSDMTGAISNTITTNHGIWSLVHDSGIENCLWGLISWNAYLPNGTDVIVKIRSSNDKFNWSDWEYAINSEYLHSTPNGRYLEVETTLNRFGGNSSPILYDLNIRALTADININCGLNNSNPNIGDTIKIFTQIINNGPDSAHNIVVSATFPPGFTSFNMIGGNLDSGIWVINDLMPGKIATLEIIGNITQNFTSKFLSFSFNETHNEYDPTSNPTNNLNLYIPFSEIKMDYSLKNGNPTLTVKNIGIDDAFNININTVIPAGFVPHTSGGTYNGETWGLISIIPNGTETMTLIDTRDSKRHDTSNPVSPHFNSSEGNNIKPIVNASSSESHKKRVNSIPMQKTGVPLNFSGIAILLIVFASYLNRNDNNLRPNKWILFFILLFFALLFIGNVSATDTNYTSSEEFQKGNYSNINTENNALKLANSSNKARDYIWVPNSNEGTISKINVKTGQELARYRTNPNSGAQPTRIAVDSQGNCWAVNRVTGSLIKIGLYENGVFDDRNHDGIIQTSQDTDKNGIITSGEVLNWGLDECVIMETIIIFGNEGTFKPGYYNGSYAAYGTGLTSLVIDDEDDLWLGIGENQTIMYINGSNGEIISSLNVSKFGHSPNYAIIDKNGILWSGGSNLLRLDPITGSISVMDMGYAIFDMTYDNEDHIFLYGNHQHWSWHDTRFSRVNVDNYSIDWTYILPVYMHTGSIAVDNNGDIWLAQYLDNWWGGKSVSFGFYSHDGIFKSDIISSISPFGLCFDSYGKLWIMDLDGEYIHRFDTGIKGIELSKRLVSTNHNALGYFSVKSPDNEEKGTWNIIHDYKTSTKLNNISWNSFEPVGTKVSVYVRSSDDLNNWSDWEKAGNGISLKFTPQGRYIDLKVDLERFNNTESPIVHDISINALNTVDNEVDLSVNISGDKSSLNIGDTVALIISISNFGPNPSDAKVNYKMPVGLKLLSSQGPGTYDSINGIWNMGILSSNSTASLNLVLQAITTGYFVNIVSVYDDSQRIMIHQPIIKSFNGKWKSLAAIDSNHSNNKASYSFIVEKSQSPGSNNFDYKWPDDLPPAPKPPQDPEPPAPKPPEPEPPEPEEPPWDRPNLPNDQLPRDIASVRSITDGVEGSKIADWTLDPFNSENTSNQEYQDWQKTMLKFSIEVAILAFMEFAPTGGSATGEYLQSVKSAILNNFKALNMISKYFNKVIKSKQISDIITKSQKIINNPTIQKVLVNWNSYLDTVGFNYGMVVFKKGLYKLFPGQEAKIDALLLTYSTCQFLNDPFGTINSIIDIITSLMKGELPERESFEKVFIFDPAQDKF